MALSSPLKTTLSLAVLLAAASFASAGDGTPVHDDSGPAPRHLEVFQVRFIAAWVLGLPEADINHDGVIDGDDLATFFNASPNPIFFDASYHAQLEGYLGTLANRDASDGDDDGADSPITVTRTCLIPLFAMFPTCIEPGALSE